MRRLLFTLFCLLSVLSIHADKAYPFPVDIVQADGTTLTIVLHGDEYFHFYSTVDGVLLVQENGNYYVAEVTREGMLRPTSLLAHNAGMRTTEELGYIQSQDRELFYKCAEEQANIRRISREPVTVSNLEFPHLGEPKAIVILAEFSDTPFTLENANKSYKQYFNHEGALEDFGRGEASNISSVRDFYKAMSFGQYQPQFDVYGPVTLPDSLKRYGGSNDHGTDEPMSKLFKDACTAMDDSLDFSQYDANEDGYVDLVIIIYAGYSQSVTGNSNVCLWPKSGNCSGGKYDGKEVSRFGINAELNGFPGCYSQPPFQRINGIGTLCHEFSHCMGLPDFYPTGNAWKGDNQAMEFWSIMDSGNYLSNGNAPAPYTAWEREAFEWYEIPTLEESGDMEINPIDYGGSAYRILNDNDPTGHEYFIIENIQNRGYNRTQKGHGLLVYHVNYNASAFSLSSNTVNNVKGKPRMTVVPADGLLFAQYNINGTTVKNKDFYDQLSGDPYPGTTFRTELNDTLDIVNFQVYNGETLNKALENITEENGVIKLTFINDFQQHVVGIAEVSKNDARPDSDLIYTIDGKLVGNDPKALPQGVYIKNGKKYLK